MYDQPPDPEPNPCPYCDAELGYGDNCEHCATVRKLDDAESALASLKLRIGHRARALADQEVHADGNPANGVSPRFMMAAATLLDLGGLKLPDDVIQLARHSVLGEYGEHVSTEKDAERIERWLAAQSRATVDGANRPLPPDVLDRRGASHLDTLWILHLADGRHVVATEAEKRAGGRVGDWTGGSGGPWNSTLREFINKALESRERSVGHWVEFALKYASPPAGDLRQGQKVSYVVGIEAYTAYVGYYQPSPYGGTGFGGAPFIVQLADGRRFFTNNNWSNGTVPQHMRSELKSNATFGAVDEAEAQRRHLQQPAAA